MISIPLIITDSHPCSYLEKKNSQSAFVHPSFELTPSIYSQLIEKGYRRSGNEVYTPHCPTCSDCVPTRIAVQQFKPNKNQKRCIKKNKNTTYVLKTAKFEQAHYDMYMRYQKHRHKEGGMAESTEEDYINFLSSSWCNTIFVEFLIGDQLAAVAIVDFLDNNLSAVYTFFEPEFSQYSLGTYAVLWQIEHAKNLNFKYLYLGYWIKDCQKMSYKTQYQPIEGYVGEEWKNI